MPYQTREPFHKTYNSQVKDKCQEVWKNVREPASKSFENALALLYPSTEDFGSFTGFDLIPENHHLFPPSSEPFWGRMDTTKYPSEAILGQTCETENEDGSRWTMQRLGPMKTTGCYDWTQMGWDNIFNLEEKLVDHPDGIFIVEQFSGPVAEVSEVCVDQTYAWMSKCIILLQLFSDLL